MTTPEELARKLALYYLGGYGVAKAAEVYELESTIQEQLPLRELLDVARAAKETISHMDVSWMREHGRGVAAGEISCGDAIELSQALQDLETALKKHST